MPLTAKGQKILSSMEKPKSEGGYGSESKAKQVLYAGANKGTFTGIHDKRRSRDTVELEIVDPPTPLEYRVALNSKDKRGRARDAFHRALDRALTGDALDPRDAALLEALVKMDKNYHREQMLPTARGESYSYDPAWKMVRNKDARRHFHHALDRVMDGPPEEMPEFIAAIRKHMAQKARTEKNNPSAEKRARYFARFESGEEPILMRDSRRARYHAALDRLMGGRQA